MYSRRRMIGVAAAAFGTALVPPAAMAAIIVRGRDSRLAHEGPNGTYSPPTTLEALIEITRRMTVPVRINGQGPFPFIVDTGANQTVIAAELAAQLSLPKGELAPLHGVAGMHIADTVVASTLEIGRRETADVTLSVLPQGAIGAMGLLGIDHFNDRMLTLDFSGRRLRVESSRRLGPDPWAVTVRSEQRDGRLSIVDADLSGIPVAAFLDSGAQRTIGNAALRKLSVPIAATDPFANTPIISATGQRIEGQFASLPALRVGGLTLHNLRCAFAELHIFKLWEMNDRPAVLLGMDVLSRFASVTLDFPRSEVRFRLAPRT